MTAESLAALQEHESFFRSVIYETGRDMECYRMPWLATATHPFPRVPSTGTAIHGGDTTSQLVRLPACDKTGSGYCVIIFFLEELPWSRVILYNKQWFLQKRHDKKRSALA